MAEAGGFKHISVTSDIDDDVVIHAGVKRPLDENVGSVDFATAFENVAAQDASQPELVSGGARQSQADEAASACAEDESEAKASGKTSQAVVARDGYHETTLDDLKSTPMSSMQKGIIVFAVLAIAVAVVYYMMFMR